jgi:tyrosyl-tRNA synthetase
LQLILLTLVRKSELLLAKRKDQERHYEHYDYPARVMRQDGNKVVKLETKALSEEELKLLTQHKNGEATAMKRLLRHVSAFTVESGYKCGIYTFPRH